MMSSPPPNFCPNCGAAYPVSVIVTTGSRTCDVCGWVHTPAGEDLADPDRTAVSAYTPGPEPLPPAGVGEAGVEAPAPAAVEAPPASPSEPVPPPGTGFVAGPPPPAPPVAGPYAGISPGAAASMASVTSGYSIASLVLGICSIFLCFCYAVPSLVCGTLAVIFSRRGERDAAAGLRSEQSLGLSKAGRITGFVGIGLGVLYLVIIVIYIIFVIFLAGGGFK